MGSNPSDASFDHCFSYGDWVDCKKETDSQRTGTPTITTINNDNNHQTTTITRGRKPHSNPQLQGVAPSYINCCIHERLEKLNTDLRWS